MLEADGIDELKVAFLIAEEKYYGRLEKLAESCSLSSSKCQIFKKIFIIRDFKNRNDDICAFVSSCQVTISYGQ